MRVFARFGHQRINRQEEFVRKRRFHRRLGPEEVKEKFGIGPELIVDYLTLAGDASDNIPGVEKVGPKTAIKWLSEYGNLQGIIDHAEQISGKVGENLRASLDRLDLYKQLVTIDCHVELEESLSELVISEANDHSLYKQFHDLGLHGLIKQFQITSNEEAAKREVNYETIITKSQLDDLIEVILNTDAVAIDFLISFTKKEMYGTDSVPPPIPIKELIMPFKRK